MFKINKECSKCGEVKPLNTEFFEPRNNTKDGFRNQCRECRRKSKNINRWTKEEKEILIKYYPFMNNYEIQEKFLPNRTVAQIMDHSIKVLKLRKDKDFHVGWSQYQIDYLKMNYTNNNFSIDEISNSIGKSRATVTAMANSLGLFREKEDIFDEKEKQIIKEYYPHMKTIDLKNRFNINKTVQQITKYANDNGIFKNEETLYNIKVENALLNLEKIPDQKAENSPLWVERVETKCNYCEEIIKRTKSKLDKSKKCFCDYNCMGNWMSDNLKGEDNPNYNNGKAWTEEMRLSCAERSVQRLVESDFKYKQTKPEIIINNSLIDLNIPFINEYNCKYYLVDFYLSKHNLMIEVQGNFYHCNPIMNLENKRINKILRKDKSKNTYIKKYKNINILYLWEKDILENENLCNKLIDLYVNSSGKLNNYHSFNYELDENNNIKLKNNTLEFIY